MLLRRLVKSCGRRKRCYICGELTFLYDKVADLPRCDECKEIQKNLVNLWRMRYDIERKRG